MSTAVAETVSVRPIDLRDALARVVAPTVGFLLPLYLLDESVMLKALATPCIAVSLLLFALSSTYDLRAGTSGARLAAVVFVLSLGIATAIHALNPRTILSINLAYPFLFVLLAYRSPSHTERFVHGLFVGLLLIVSFGWYRFFLGEGGSWTEHALGYWGIKYTTSTRNGEALAPAILTAFALEALWSRRARGGRMGLFMTLTIGLPALILSYSRSIWLALACFCVVGFVVRLRQAGRVLAPVFLCLLVAWFGLSTWDEGQSDDFVDTARVAERMRSIYDTNIESSNYERSRLLAYAVALGAQHAAIGVGPGNFHVQAEAYGFPDVKGLLHPENLLLHLFTEFGVLPAISLFGLLFATCLAARRSRARERHFAFAATVSLLVWVQFNSALSSLLMWVVLGVACSVMKARTAVAER